MANPRSKMRRSHQKAIEWLLNNDFNFVWITPHIRWDNPTYFKGEEKVFSKDIAGLFDGMAVKNGMVYFLQIKSNSWASYKRYKLFCDKYKIKSMLINVVDREGVKVKMVE